MISRRAGAAASNIAAASGVYPTRVRVAMQTMASSSTAAVPPRYQGFGAMPLAGEWRPGSSGKIVADTDPWSGATLAEIPLADREDLDEALAAAQRAQRGWAARPPAARAD